MKKIITGMQIMLSLTSLSAFSQATFSKEMIERNLKEKKAREEAYKTYQVEAETRKTAELKKKREKDSIIKLKDLELKEIWAKEAAQRNAEAEENRNFESNLNKEEILRNVASEDKNKEQFTFDKIALSKLEKVLKNSDYYTEEQKDIYSSLILIDVNTADISEGQNVKLSSFLATDKFVGASGELSTNNFSIIKEIKTQKLYAIHTFVRYWKDYSASSVAGHESLIKYIPIPLSPEKQGLLIRYKALIKKGQTNTTNLRAIQNKCLNRGYFDELKMTKQDKQIWNKNFSDLKNTYGKLSDINQFEDKDNQVEDKLSTKEILSLSDFNTWLSNFSIID